MLPEKMNIKRRRKMYCGYCGEKIQNNCVRCPRCGNFVDEYDGVVGTRKDKSNSGLLALLIGLIGLAVILSMIFIIYGIKQKNNNKNTEDTTGEIYVEKEESYPAIPEFTRVVASSTLPNALGYTYYAENVMDKNRKTAWNEGATEEGEGETLTFYADGKQRVSGIRILNGYCQDSKTYHNNNRVKRIRIWFSDGTSCDHVIHDVFDEYTNIEFTDGKICDTVVFTIMDVYKGSKYNETCISEIEFY